MSLTDILDRAQNLKVLEQARPCDCVYIILSGHVAIVKTVDLGGGSRRRVRVEVGRVGPGQHFSSCYQEVVYMDGGIGGGGGGGGGGRVSSHLASSSWATNVVTAGEVSPFSVVTRGEVELLKIPSAKFFFFLNDAVPSGGGGGGDPAPRLRQFGLTSPTLPADGRIVQCVRAQLDWSKYHSQLVDSIRSGESHGAKLKHAAKQLSKQTALEKSLGLATGGGGGGSSSGGSMPRLYAATKSFRHRVHQTLADKLHAAMPPQPLGVGSTTGTAAAAVSAARSMMVVRSGDTGAHAGSGRGGAGGAAARPQSLPNLQLPWAMSPVPKLLQTPTQGRGAARGSSVSVEPRAHRDHTMLPPIGSP